MVNALGVISPFLHFTFSNCPSGDMEKIPDNDIIDLYTNENRSRMCVCARARARARARVCVCVCVCVSQCV